MVEVIVKKEGEKDPYGVENMAYSLLQEENQKLYEQKLAHLRDELTGHKIIVIINMDNKNIEIETEPALTSPLREKVIEALS